MITITLPTRNRPANLLRCVNALFENADEPGEVEIICVVDDDDTMSQFALDKLSNKYNHNFLFIEQSRNPNLSQLHNDCLRAASNHYEIAAFWGDDCVMETQGWDTLVRNEFNKFDDKILLCGGSDTVNNDIICHGFVSREWIDITGELTPNNMYADWADTHLNDIAKELGRWVRLPFVNRHLHPSAYSDVRPDQTYVDKVNRGNQQNTGGLYYSDLMVQYRKEQVTKLRNFMENYNG